jgi:uncharacterized membrane protein
MREVMLIVHFIGLVMGIGTSFALLFLGIASSKMEQKEGQKFKLNSFSLIRMAHIGLGLLIISGGYLMTPHWKILADSPLLIAKLVLVVVLGAFIGIIGSTAKKAKKGDAEIHLKKLGLLGKLALITGLTIIVLAVNVFK